jgi:phage tail sheath protein FI
MPIPPTYPGVYLEEVGRGGHAIAGVDTAITACIGRAARGPVNRPVEIRSTTEFERIFGGLWSGSAAGFAVRDFFQNGGSHLVFVRLHNAAKAATFRLRTAERNRYLRLLAASEGAWGHELRLGIETIPRDKKLFHLNVEERDPVTGRFLPRERFESVSTGPRHARFIATVLESDSSLVRVVSENGQPVVPGALPVAGITTATADSGQDGRPLTSPQVIAGLAVLDACELWNILCIPPYRAGESVGAKVIQAAAAYCERSRAFFLIDPPVDWTSAAQARAGIAEGIGTTSANAALYFPRVKAPNPLKKDKVEEFAPCGAVAGVLARIDASRGVWKAPAGAEASLRGVTGLSLTLTDAQNGPLNALAVNSLRTLPGAGPVVWGSRTLQGADSLASEWKYIPVRRTALFLEQSIDRGTQWAVFERNDEALWAQIRLSVGAFLESLFRQGAFQGATSREAYYVKCDRTTMTQNDLDDGVLVVVVGFAPLRPAEFVVLTIRQMVGKDPE